MIQAIMGSHSASPELLVTFESAKKSLAQVLDNDTSMAIDYSIRGSNSGCETNGYQTKAVD
jgi:hypothetical protein